VFGSEGEKKVARMRNEAEVRQLVSVGLENKGRGDWLSDVMREKVDKK
jgi:hypothetical protein